MKKEFKVSFPQHTHTNAHIHTQGILSTNKNMKIKTPTTSLPHTLELVNGGVSIKSMLLNICKVFQDMASKI